MAFFRWGLVPVRWLNYPNWMNLFQSKIHSKCILKIQTMDSILSIFRHYLKLNNEYSWSASSSELQKLDCAKIKSMQRLRM